METRYNSCTRLARCSSVSLARTNGQADERYRQIASLFTIHNLTYQGRSSWDVFSYLGVQTHRLVEEGLGEVNFMARGIYHSTLINTVSPTYAREILTPDNGASLDGLLRIRHYDLHGILNGLDTEIWNPTMDKNLVKPFRPSELENRIENKRALQVRLGTSSNEMFPFWQWSRGLINKKDWISLATLCINIE